MLEKEGPNDGLVSLQSAKWVRVPSSSPSHTSFHPPSYPTSPFVHPPLATPTVIPAASLLPQAAFADCAHPNHTTNSARISIPI